MQAALVTALGSAPRSTDIAEPTAGEHEVVVDVLAAGLHPRVRSQADGSHYAGTGELPFVPGVDGVGRDPDGRLRYFALDGTGPGSMAERTVVDLRASVVLPERTDPIAVAAAMNPAMSSWVALRRRIRFEAGQDVLVLGATGNAGRMAVRIARLLGAGRVVAAGRDATRLGALADGTSDATDTVSLVGSDEEVGTRLAAAAADVDVVLDYLWGEPMAVAVAAIVTERSDRRRPLTWIEIGSSAGVVAPIPSAALRASQLQIVGSGQGSVGTADIVAELPEIAAAIDRGDVDVDARAVPLAEVEAAWDRPAGAVERVVIVPGGAPV
jgi:NADPH:quinone reductase-like Zn-dependent oxidoreductase